MDGQGVVVAAGLAATWGILVSLIIGIMDARKPMETWQKAAWALGLCFLPFVAWFVWLVASGGLHDFEVALANAVDKAMQSYGGAFAGHSGQKMVQKRKSSRGSANPHSSSWGAPVVHAGVTPQRRRRAREEVRADGLRVHTDRHIVHCLHCHGRARRAAAVQLRQVRLPGVRMVRGSGRRDVWPGLFDSGLVPGFNWWIAGAVIVWSFVVVIVTRIVRR
jgi:hypothetical protein